VRTFFSVYQVLGPAIFLPLAYWLWLGRVGRHDLVIGILAVPCIVQYILPAIGTNVLNLWEINTRVRAGKFRPHHGFVFGAATAFFAFLVTSDAPQPLSAAGVARAALIMGSVLGFWNWLYDILAIRTGHIRIYTQPYADGRCADAMATDHAPMYFGTFGAIYGAGIEIALGLKTGGLLDQYGLPLLMGTITAALILPVLGYIATSYLQYGHNGLKSFKPASGGNGD
jgi:hypothetical protein